MAVAVAPGRLDAPLDAAGLTEAEAARRLSRRGRAPRRRSSRSYASIVRANVFTVFNLILAVAGAVTLAFGEWQDALFLGVLVANAAIGTVQEVRAKRALDRLSALVAPHATVVRDGDARIVPVEEVVVGDLVQVGPGDQVVADGTLEQADTLRVDESILTGEAEPIAREPGDEPCAPGRSRSRESATYTVTAVGADSYAARLTGEARSFRHPRSPLERALNQLLFVLVAVMVPLGVVLGYALWHRHAALHTAVPTTVAAVVTLVPEGLILLASLTYAVAALRMARRGALGAAAERDRVARLRRRRLPRQDRHADRAGAAGRRASSAPTSLADELGGYAASSAARNATLAAIAEAYPSAAAPVEEQMPFSSRRASARSGSAASATCSARPSTSTSDGLADDGRAPPRQRGGACSPSGLRTSSTRTSPGRTGSSSSPSVCDRRRVRPSSGSGARASS